MKDYSRHSSAALTGRAGDPTLANEPGEPCVKTTAPMAQPGIICPMMWHARKPIAGEKMDWRVSATPPPISFSPWPPWKDATPFSKKAPLVCPAPKANHAKQAKKTHYYFLNTLTTTH